jgi:hypothetical protein
VGAIDATSGAGTAYTRVRPVFSGIHVARSFVFYAVFVRSLFVLLTFFFWPLCCLFFFYLRIMITPLVSSNSSYPVPAPIVTPVLFTLVKHYVISYKGGDEDVIVLPVFVDRFLCFCPFSPGHCIVYSSSNYGFWLSL